MRGYVCARHMDDPARCIDTSNPVDVIVRGHVLGVGVPVYGNRSDDCGNACLCISIFPPMLLRAVVFKISRQRGHSIAT
jgi:hypothetical protein